MTELTSKTNGNNYTRLTTINGKYTIGNSKTVSYSNIIKLTGYQINE